MPRRESLHEQQRRKSFRRQRNWILPIARYNSLFLFAMPTATRFFWASPSASSASYAPRAALCAVDENRAETAALLQDPSDTGAAPLSAAQSHQLLGGGALLFMAAGPLPAAN